MGVHKDWSDYIMAFYDYKEPIEYVVENYFQKAKWNHSNSSLYNTMSFQSPVDRKLSLPEIPCKVFRNDDNLIYKVVYGNLKALEMEEECSPVIWQQEIIRDNSGKIVKILTTYPDGEINEEKLIRDNNGKFEEYK